MDIRTKILLPVLWQLDKILPAPSHPWNQPGNMLENFFWWEIEHADRTISKLASQIDIKGKRILDVGCGSGGKAVALAQHGAVIVGIDLSREAVSTGNTLISKHFPHLISKISLVIGDIVNPPQDIGQFDIVFMDDVWEHLQKPELSLISIHRLLRENGVVFIAFPPYTHPWGAHVSDLINIPWIQYLLWEKYIVRWYILKALKRPDGKLRLKFKGITPHSRRIEYINRMTLEKTLRIVYDLRRLYRLIWFDMDLLNVPFNSAISKIPRIGKYVVSKYYLLLQKRDKR